MSKMSELSTAVSDLERCAEALLMTANVLREIFSTQDAAPTEPAAPMQPAPKPLTIDEVRPVLARKASEGKSDAVKALLAKYNVKRLSDVDPTLFADLLQEAEVL